MIRRGYPAVRKSAFPRNFPSMFRLPDGAHSTPVRGVANRQSIPLRWRGAAMRQSIPLRWRGVAMRRGGHGSVGGARETRGGLSRRHISVGITESVDTYWLGWSSRRIYWKRGLNYLFEVTFSADSVPASSKSTDIYRIRDGWRRSWLGSVVLGRTASPAISQLARPRTAKHHRRQHPPSPVVDCRLRVAKHGVSQPQTGNNSTINER